MTPGRALATALVGAALVASCGSDEPDAAPTTIERPTDVDRAAAEAAALDIRATGCGPRVGFGSGSVIDERLAVTAAHVVAGADAVTAVDVEGRETAASVVHFDPELDLALLRLDREVGTPIAVRADDAETGEQGVVVIVRWVGDELERDVVEVEVLRTVNISTTDIYLDGDVDRAGFEVEGSVDPGDSGALVVLPGGGVGIVWARSNRRENRAWGIDLPAVVLDPAARSPLVDPVDVGPCR